MMLSEHFSLAELTISQTASRLNLDNTPGPGTLEHLKVLAQTLEKVRALLGKPLLINSGYRSIAVNRAVGGVGTSAHCLGYAADFICPAFGTPLDIAKALAASDLKWDQVIEEHTWLHISVDPRMRQQVLTMRDGRYVVGLG
jgi:zinc D-Ala-D-Ala carboxypeptidase